MTDDADDPAAYAEVTAILARAEELPHGAGKVAAIEDAVARADIGSDEWLAYAVRQELLWPAYHGSRPDLVLVHFAWCLAYLDRHPEESPFQTLWQYRWVVDAMPNFAQVTRAQVELAWADMRERYARGGHSPRPVWLNRRRICAKMGDGAGAAAAHESYKKARRDAMSDSRDQDAAFAVDYAEFLRDDATTVRLARKLLADPASDAQDILQAADDSIMAFLRLGHVAEAEAHFERAVKRLARHRQFLGGSSHFLPYLVVRGDLGRAAKFSDRNFPAALAEPGEFGWYAYYQGVLFLTRALTDAGRDRLRLAVPARFVPGVEGGRVKPSQLREHLEAALPDLAARMDARNGNGYYTSHLADLTEYAELAAIIRKGRP